MKQSGSLFGMRYFAFGMALLAPLAGALAFTEGKTQTGRPYVAGGVGLEEVEAMRQQAPSFSLQLVTAARTGAYLAGTQVRIVDAMNRVVLDTTINGPWLMVDLASGRYIVQATHHGKTVKRRLQVTQQKPQQVVLQFDVAVDQDASAAPTTAPTTTPR